VMVVKKRGGEKKMTSNKIKFPETVDVFKENRENRQKLNIDCFVVNF